MGALRLSPHTGDMVAVSEAIRRFADGVIEPEALRAAVEGAGPPGALVNGYLAGLAGMQPAGRG